MAAAGALLLVVALVVYSLVARRRAARQRRQVGAVWRRGYHVATEVLSGRNVVANRAALAELLKDTPEPLLVTSAVAVAVRQETSDHLNEVVSVVANSRIPSLLGARMASTDALARTEVLEFVEVLRIHTLIGDAAALVGDPDRTVVRAACDAVVSLDPSAGLGLLLGLAQGGESWVLDSLGRAVSAISKMPGSVVPLSPSHWRTAPVLARRALDESAFFDRATTTDAVNALVDALQSSSSSQRLAAVGALAASIDHAAAQLALAGALGSPDRMTRYAVAASLVDTVAGQRILRRAAADADGSDAARMAAEVLWGIDDEPDEVIRHAVAS